MIQFITNALSHKGENSSKRLAGFIILIYTMVMYPIIDMSYDVFLTWLGASLLALGISGMEKVVELKNKQ
jgi:hypothetical protein